MPERLGPKLLSWASQLDPETRRQAERTATLPFVHPHVALMADAHLDVVAHEVGDTARGVREG